MSSFDGAINRSCHNPASFRGIPRSSGPVADFSLRIWCGRVRSKLWVFGRLRSWLRSKRRIFDMLSAIGFRDAELVSQCVRQHQLQSERASDPKTEVNTASQELWYSTFQDEPGEVIEG